MTDNDQTVQPTEVSPVENDVQPTEVEAPKDPSQPEITQNEPTENPAKPEASDPHPVDEDPEELSGEEVADPWDNGKVTWDSLQDDKAKLREKNEENA